MSRITSFAKGVGIGAGLMYAFDPDQGRRRRAMVRDQIVGAYCDCEEGLDAAWRDVQNRLQGISAGWRSLFEGDQASDDVVRERVRSKLGRYVSHPSSIEVSVEGGRVTLSGPVLASEVENLIACVRSVRG